jgi:hypothetical protein
MTNDNQVKNKNRMKNKDFHASIRKIIEAKDQNKLVIFVGAGVSMNSEIPSWNNLINTMSNDLNIGDEKDFIKIAELYYRQRGNNEYITKVREVLKYKRTKYSSLHKLIFDLKPLHIITTNYDDLLEQYANENSLPYQVIKQDKDLPYSNGNNYIIKMHGDLETGNIVLKESDYLKYEVNFPLIESYIKSLFASKLVLFLGFSYSDYNLKFITQKVLNHLGENIQPSYLVDLKSTGSDALQVDYLRSYGVSVLHYDSEINDVACDLTHEGGKKMYNLLTYIKKYNEFEIETRGLSFITKLDKGFQKYSEFNILVPARIVEILKSIGVNSHTDIENPHCLVINNPKIKEFIVNKNADWRKAISTEEKLALLEVFLGNSFSSNEKEVILFVWQKILLSGIYYLTYEKITPKTVYLEMYDPTQLKDEELDLFYKCDFVEVERKINNLKESFAVNDLIIAAFLTYKTGNYYQAYQLLNKASRLAWQEGKYLKYYLCKYNIEKIKWYFRPFENSSTKELYTEIYDDINQIDINEIYYTLPLKDRKLVKSLITDFIKYDFKNIDFNITKRVAGDKFSFENHTFISNKVFQTWNFINYNYLFGEHFDEYRQFYKNSFNEFLKSNNSESNNLRRVDILIAVHNLINSEISEALERNKIVELKIFPHDLSETKKDFLTLLKSCEKLIKGHEFENKKGYSKLIFKLINNYLQILAYVKFNDNTPEELIKNIFSNIFTRTTYNMGVHEVSPNLHGLSESIGKFIINQDVFGATFQEATLNSVLDATIDETHYHEKGLLMYVAHLLKKKNPNYKLPNEHFEKRIAKNFEFDRYIEILISLQPILDKDYSAMITESLKKSLNKRFDLHLFEIGLNGGYLKYEDYKPAIYAEIKERITHTNFWNVDAEETYFATIILENNTNIGSDKELNEIITLSPLLQFWLTLDKFDFSNFKIHWVLNYNDILFEEHKKSKKIYEIKNRIMKTMEVWDNTRNLAVIYFKYFETLK